MLGDDRTVIGWLRSPACGGPAWECSSPDGGFTAWLTVPGGALQWQASFFDPTTGEARGAPVALARATPDATLEVPLPEFTDDLAFVLGAVEP